MPPAEPPTRTLALFGTFDVGNYGDLLFPLVAEQRLAEAGIRIRTIAPTRAVPPFRDAAATESIDDLSRDTRRPDAIAIGGGNIIHLRDTGLPEYERDGMSGIAYPALWLGATLIAAAADVPVVWNAPGVIPPLFPDRSAARVAAALRAADLVAVRDAPSAAVLYDWCGETVPVVPDTALDLPRLWPRAALVERFRAICGRAGFAPGRRFVAVHVKERSLPGISAAAFAAMLARRIEAVDGVAILVALGPCHGDGRFAGAVSAALVRPHICLAAPEELKDIAACVAGADAHVGASLHGYLTSVAYGTPSIMVAVPALAKFAGTAGLLDRPGDVAADWPAALDALDSLIGRGRATPAPPRPVADRLDEHWRAIVDAVGVPSRRRRERRAFMALFDRHTMTASSLAPSLAPLVEVPISRITPRTPATPPPTGT